MQMFFLIFSRFLALLLDLLVSSEHLFSSGDEGPLERGLPEEVNGAHGSLAVLLRQSSEMVIIVMWNNLQAKNVRSSLPSLIESVGFSHDPVGLFGVSRLGESPLDHFAQLGPGLGGKQHRGRRQAQFQIGARRFPYRRKSDSLLFKTMFDRNALTLTQLLSALFEVQDVIYELEGDPEILSVIHGL